MVEILRQVPVEVQSSFLQQLGKWDRTGRGCLQPDLNNITHKIQIAVHKFSVLIIKFFSFSSCFSQWCYKIVWSTWKIFLVFLLFLVNYFPKLSKKLSFSLLVRIVVFSFSLRFSKQWSNESIESLMKITCIIQFWN